ncbi:cytochrome b/b6 domain-containing protein [Candidatus Symbiobacter mobilis]|uniref:Cytochrome b n=1 Tax=Candidatus Symbiobacter mobilis CR TaxID=946483 RepID=U5N7M1_9BURK|nr:cytochrome b/b6 domain-containing protein [Candidatus Symbiobacter mobilis]AGX87315.1 cytochrome b [Candidatus Symbiobacter mobilis CR]
MDETKRPSLGVPAAEAGTPIPPIPENGVYVWDLFVRVFHWSLVSCIALNEFVLDAGGLAHRWAGYAACALVLARIVWGFVGTSHARFNDFFPTPSRLLFHIQSLLRGQPPHYVGHNPIGALVMLAMMGIVLCMAVTGWMQGLDAFWGEEWLMEAHETLAHLLLLCVGLHATAAIVMGRIERTALITAMVTGVKRRY